MQSALEFLKEIFNINDQTAATITITLFVFVSGFLLNGLKNSISRALSRRNLRRLIIINTVELSKKSKELSKEFASFSEQLKDFENVPSLSRTGVPQVQIFREIGYLKSSNAFFSGFRSLCISDSIRHSFIELWEIIDDIEYWEDQNPTISEYNKQFGDYNSKRNKALLDFQRSLESELTYANIMNKDPDISEYYGNADRILKDWQVESNTKPDIIQRMLVEEFLKLNRKTDHSKVQKVIEFNHYLLEASLNFSNLHILNSQFCEFYQKLSTSYKNKSSRLDRIIKDLSTYWPR